MSDQLPTFKEKPPKKVHLRWKGNIYCIGSVEHPTYQIKIIPLHILEDNTNIYETYCMQHFCSMLHIYFSTSWKDTFIFLQ